MLKRPRLMLVGLSFFLILLADQAEAASAQDMER